MQCCYHGVPLRLRPVHCMMSADDSGMFVCCTLQKLLQNHSYAHSHSAAAAVASAAGAIFCCLSQGALLGGAVGDRMAKRLPNNGRILTAQISVFCGIPLTWLLLKGLPSSSLAATPVAYGVVMFVMGLTCTWAGAGCNSPIFAEIVPDELRSTIYAFDR